MNQVFNKEISIFFDFKKRRQTSSDSSRFIKHNDLGQFILSHINITLINTTNTITIYKLKQYLFKQAVFIYGGAKFNVFLANFKPFSIDQ